MTDPALLSRIDAHMARTNEHMERGNELMARVIELHEDQRRFTRDLTRRTEIVLGEMVSEVRAGRQVLVDLHEESVAQREAIWTLIDELRSHGLGGRD